jgi:hypothetical protein
LLYTNILAVSPLSHQRRAETPAWLANLKACGVQTLLCDNSRTGYWKELARLGTDVIEWYDREREDGGRPERKIAGSFNALRDVFLKTDFTHMWLVEWDIYPTKELLLNLLAYDQPVMAVPYFSKGTEIILQGQFYTRESTLFNFNAPFPPSTMFTTPVPRFYSKDATTFDTLWTTPGTGCVLLRRDAVAHLPFRYDESRPETTPDTWLWMDILEKQIPAYFYNLDFVTHKHKSWMEL